MVLPEAQNKTAIGWYGIVQGDSKKIRQILRSDSTNKNKHFLSQNASINAKEILENFLEYSRHIVYFSAEAEIPLKVPVYIKEKFIELSQKKEKKKKRNRYLMNHVVLQTKLWYSLPQSIRTEK